MKAADWGILGTFLLVTVDVISSAQPAPAPTPKLVLPATVTQVYDGDTLTCEFKLKARVRLLECWAPELRDNGGPESKQNLQQLAEGKPANVVIDLSDADRFDDVLTFGRILAHVWVDGKDLSAEQRASGHATRNR